MGKYTSNEIRKRLIEAVVNRGSTIKEAAEWLDLKYRTAVSIYNTFAQHGRLERKKNPGARVKYGSMIRDQILSLFAANPALTLKKCQSYFRERPNQFDGLVPSLSTINSVLVTNNITLKELRKVPKGRNLPATIKLRKLYVLKWLEIEETRHFIYLDEFGCNIALRRGKGRSRRGRRAFVEVPQQGHNLSVCAAMDINGPIYHRKQYASYDSDSFVSFLEELVPKLPTIAGKENILVMDNVAFHKTMAVRSLLYDLGIKFMYTPPYTPMLNPIEELFSKVKTFIKSAESTSNTTLFDAIDRGFETITAEDCQGYIRYSKSFHPRCLTEQKIYLENEIEEEEEDENSDNENVDCVDELLGGC